MARSIAVVVGRPHFPVFTQQLTVILPLHEAKSSKKTVIGSRFGAPVITSFVTDERLTCIGAAIWLSVGMALPRLYIRLFVNGDPHGY